MHVVVWGEMFLLAPFMFLSWILQHQQQVLQAMERAKQVTMGELNSVIGVSKLVMGGPPNCSHRWLCRIGTHTQMFPMGKCVHDHCNSQTPEGYLGCSVGRGGEGAGGATEWIFPGPSFFSPAAAAPTPLSSRPSHPIDPTPLRLTDLELGKHEYCLWAFGSVRGVGSSDFTCTKGRNRGSGCGK